MGPWPSTDGAVRPSVSAVTTSTERPVLRRNPNDRVALTKCGRLRVSEHVRPESPGELDDDDDAFALLLEAHLSACVAVEAGPAGDGLGSIAVVDIGLRCVLGGDLAALEGEGHEVLCRFRVACCGHYPESVGAAHRCAGQVLNHAVEGGGSRPPPRPSASHRCLGRRSLPPRVGSSLRSWGRVRTGYWSPTRPETGEAPRPLRRRLWLGQSYPRHGICS